MRGNVNYFWPLRYAFEVRLSKTQLYKNMPQAKCWEQYKATGKKRSLYTTTTKHVTIKTGLNPNRHELPTVILVVMDTVSPPGRESWIEGEPADRDSYMPSQLNSSTY